jgi:hypothetical protein
MKITIGSHLSGLVEDCVGKGTGRLRNAAHPLPQVVLT